MEYSAVDCTTMQFNVINCSIISSFSFVYYSPDLYWLFDDACKFRYYSYYMSFYRLNKVKMMMMMIIIIISSSSSITIITMQFNNNEQYHLLLSLAVALVT